MKKTPALLAGVFWMGAMCVASRAEGPPKIQFDRTLYDFGKTTHVANVSGVFRFKNVGDGVLKVEPPEPSGDCMVADVKPDTIPPGATGELRFTLDHGVYRANLLKHIAVRSNDPQTPEVSLGIKVDFIPLYELSPRTISPDLAFAGNDTTQFTTLTRTDGKPLRIARLESSQPWITATVEPDAQEDETAARIRVAIRRSGPPRRFIEHVQIYAAGQTNAPVSSLYVYGRILGEVSLEPETLYWSIPDAEPTPAGSPEAPITRRVTIRSADGQRIELKNPQSTIKGMKVELAAKEAGRVYELVARLDDPPVSTVSGNLSFETSVAEQPRIEVPFTVVVYKP
jgi:hypothetical protein